MSSFMDDLWSGMIPTEFSMCTSDVASVNPPEKIHLLLPRFSYLPIAADTAIDQFKRLAVEFDHEIWFAYEDEPLKSNLPVGVLFDICQQKSLPWKLTVHFRMNQSQHVTSINEALAEKLFFHDVKQAVYLMHSHTRAFTSLSIPLQNQLWESVTTNKPQSHREIFSSILSENDNIKYIPTRVILRGYPTTQKPITVYRSNSEVLTTLGDVLEVFFGKEKERTNFPAENSLRLLIHGIEVPSSTPLLH